ncbi:hypothetical protein NUW54_g6665 [Trametes sanguinea]|uniref:Uncharacterized protein n=1 Tax=Trametes sanguinea TaxID=158606 RepID=A0ACC1PRL1_9APHY|nr:hypothetical protein NUW54_g6665 [Trametes sanguinea]
MRPPANLEYMGYGGVKEVKNDTSRAGIGARPKEDADEQDEKPRTGLGHRTVPLTINEWEGKKGIGLGKRARSPTAPERLAKMAKMAEERDHLSFRDRARQEYEERRAVGRLAPAQRTCATLDEKAGIQVRTIFDV